MIVAWENLLQVQRLAFATRFFPCFTLHIAINCLAERGNITELVKLNITCLKGKYHYKGKVGQ